MAETTYRNGKVESRTLKTNVKRDATYKSRKVENRAGQTKSIRKEMAFRLTKSLHMTATCHLY